MGDYIIKLDIWCILFLQGSDSINRDFEETRFYRISPQSLLDI